MTNQQKFESALPRLLASYDKGLLTPFIGAGTSVPNCASWTDFIENLEQAAGIEVPQPLPFECEADECPKKEQQARVSPDVLVQRAARAVRKLKYESMDYFAAAVRDAVWNHNTGYCPDNRGDCPAGAAALSKIWWPLVITTNYDDWFVNEWNSKRVNSGHRLPDWERMHIVGRADRDCERVMNSLRTPDNPLLWALQGFLTGFHPLSSISSKLNPLSSELVVGHEEYRSVAHRSPGFRRAFSEVFRSRSLLFYGSGLQEGYFVNLFDEVLELQGALQNGHFALVLKSSVNAQFLRERYQIEVLEYDEHFQATEWMEQLQSAINAPRARESKWGISFNMGPSDEWRDVTPSFEVVRQKLPKPKESECILVSAGILGNSNLPALSTPANRALEDHFQISPAEVVSSAHLLHKEPMLWRLDEKPCFIVAARDLSFSGQEFRDARVVFTAMQAALQAAVNAGFFRMYSSLLATGSGRVFPSHVALIQMMRAYAQSPKQLELVVCAPDPWCNHLLTSGRLNLAEIALTRDIRFRLEIVRTAGSVLRFVEVAPPDAKLKEILKKYDLPSGGWRVYVLPSPIRQEKMLTSGDIMFNDHDPEPWTVGSIGLMQGSTLKIVL